MEEKEIVEDENKIDTVIADDIDFKGSLSFKNSLKIKGDFEGRIETDGHLIIGQEATVNASVKAGIVTVNGTLSGNIKANKYIELNKKSKSNCDIVTPNLYIEKGSVFNGTCLMNNTDEN